MACEDGIVTRLDGNMAWVKTHRAEACEHCSARDGCRAMGGGGKEMDIEVENTLGAVPGDIVCVSVLDSSFLKASFLVYMVPVLGLVAGAVWGDSHGASFGMSGDMAAALAGLVGLVVTFSVVRVVANKLGADIRYKPRMQSIRQKGAGKLPPNCREEGDKPVDNALRVTTERLHPPEAGREE